MWGEFIKKTLYTIKSYWKMEWSRGMKKRKKKCCFICKSPMPGSGGLCINNIIPLHKLKVNLIWCWAKQGYSNFITMVMQNTQYAKLENVQLTFSSLTFYFLPSKSKFREKLNFFGPMTSWTHPNVRYVLLATVTLLSYLTHLVYIFAYFHTFDLVLDF